MLTWLVMAACSSLLADLTPCWVMNVFSTPVSVFCGYLEIFINHENISEESSQLQQQTRKGINKCISYGGARIILNYS